MTKFGIYLQIPAQQIFIDNRKYYKKVYIQAILLEKLELIHEKRIQAFFIRVGFELGNKEGKGVIVEGESDDLVRFPLIVS
ncbi:hypothetical protein [Paenibacillus amylolyticus]|uniref:hypothetical protein n=1 Tax=Paenibacillus amylolyticus TaxID=1451 RepID=UPI00201D5F60|nr:hypothetical protein [Paenibacillus amylolyticus]MCL6663379.1 hypothetical protein [Paenibacillus amylolyticus]